ncbi:MAG: substrate-binding periplasmic protein [Pseudomonadota bacterium]
MMSPCSVRHGPAFVLLVAGLLAGPVAAGTADTAPAPVRCATEPYPPYVSPALPGNGWLWELVHAAFASQGIEATLEFLPWARAVEETRSGARDCLLAAFHTEERARWFIYSQPIGEVRTGFFRRRDRTDIRFDGSMDSLRRWSIGVGRHYANSELFDRDARLNKIPLDSSEQGMRMLYLRRIDLMAGAETVDRYHLRHALEPQHPGIGDAVEFIEPPLQVQPLYAAFSRQRHDHAGLVRIFNAGLAKLKSDGTWRRIEERHRND